MKVSIGSNIVEGPWGGGNAFVKNLSQYLREKDHEVVYDLKDNDIDVILFTDPRYYSEGSAYSANDIKKYLKYVNYNAVVFHRINECDQRKSTEKINQFYVNANKIADCTIYVSSWLKEIYKHEGIQSSRQYVILGGANEEIFNRNNFQKWDGKTKLKIVTHHWGANWNKGFDIYKKIDDMLIEDNFNTKYSFTFIGNIPDRFSFKNSTHIDPIAEKELSEKLKEHHLYLTASLNEPSGNHHIEAAQCGLPLLFIESGGIPEHCEGYGVSFNNENFKEKLYEITQNYDEFFNLMKDYPLSSKQMCKEYLNLFETTLNEKDLIYETRTLEIKNNKIFSFMYHIIRYLKKVITKNKIYRKFVYGFIKE